METRIKASVIATFRPETDPSDGAWQDYHRYGNDSTPAVRPVMLRVKTQLSMTADDTWQIVSVGSDLVHDNIKKNGETGERRGFSILFGHDAIPYKPLIDQAVQEVKDRFRVEDDS